MSGEGEVIKGYFDSDVSEGRCQWTERLKATRDISLEGYVNYRRGYLGLL